MKSYISHYIKVRLPLFIIIAALLFIVGIISIGDVDFIIDVMQGSNGYYVVEEPTNAGIFPITFAVSIIAMIMPLFNMSYRYSLAKTDMFRQVAQSKKKFRYIDHGISLAFILIAFTIAFAVLVISIAIKNQVQPIPVSTDGHSTYYKIYFHYWIYALVYLVIIAFIIGNYFISYLLVSRSNNVLNSIIILIMGQFFLASFCTIFAEMAQTNNTYFFQMPLSNASVSFAPFFVQTRYTFWIINGDSSFEYGLRQVYWVASTNETNFSLALSFIVFFGVALFGLFMFLFEKDPSGEWAGKPETGNIHQELFFHISVGSLMTFVFYQHLKYWYDGTIPSLIASFATYAALYYTLLGLLKRNFKPKLSQILVMLGNTALVVIMGIIIFACNNFQSH